LATADRSAGGSVIVMMMMSAAMGIGNRTGIKAPAQVKRHLQCLSIIPQVPIRHHSARNRGRRASVALTNAGNICKNRRKSTAVGSAIVVEMV